MPLLFAVTLFASAVLLFWIEPLIARMLLPLLGGTPSVWNTCMLFFQGMLLAGYAYALALTRRLAVRRQVLVHLALLCAAALVLPVSVAGEAAAARDIPSEGSPVFWLLGSLFRTLGLPFFVLAASAPLLQRWFASTRHSLASDPYFLYAASNAGSLIALVGFPLLLEPNWTLREQARIWAVVYGVLVALVFACAFVVWRAGRENAKVEAGEPESASTNLEAGAPAESAPDAARRVRWTLLAFVPSSLVLGVTTYITTDVAAVPLLWVIPLALYLLTFILVFARRSRAKLASRNESRGARVSWLNSRYGSRLLPGAAILLTVVYLSGATEPAWFLVLLHLLFLFVAAYVCHRQLADDRPAAQHLAEFYLWIAVGGVLGGLFNALVAPLLFNQIIEYPLAIIIACLLRPMPERKRDEEEKELAPLNISSNLKFLSEEEARRIARGTTGERTDDGGSSSGARGADGRRALLFDALLPVGVGLLTALLALVFTRIEMGSVERLAIVLGFPLMLINHFFTWRRWRFALALAAVMLGSIVLSEAAGRTLFTHRNFYGTLQVRLDPSGATRRLYHGSTMHGRQFTNLARRCEPLSYYHRTGPLGAVFDVYTARPTAPGVAVVGLGTGASAAYATEGQRWTFYEINPAVARLARDTRFFTYLDECAHAPVEIVLGDARLKLQQAADARYGLIILDAFSSDAIPAHLLTREALELYLARLATGGLIALHVSNRSLDLDRVALGLAREAGLAARVFDDVRYEPSTGREPSTWVVVARRAEDLGALAEDARWRSLEDPKRAPVVWSDDFSNIISVFKW